MTLPLSDESLVFPLVQQRTKITNQLIIPPPTEQPIVVIPTNPIPSLPTNPTIIPLSWFAIQSTILPGVFPEPQDPLPRNLTRQEGESS